MANSVIKITFVSLPYPGDTIDVLAHLKVPPFDEWHRIETFETVRGTNGETTIGTDVNDQAQKYYDAFLIDYGSQFGVSVSGAVVTITCTAESSFDSFNGADISGAFATFELVPTDIIVEGIEADRYYVNNPIVISMFSDVSAESYTITFQNDTNQKTSVPAVIYASPSGVAKIDIAPYIKSLFDYPEDYPLYISPNQIVRNANDFTITIQSGGAETIMERTFIRGGKYTTLTNESTATGTTCRPTELLPVWDNYPTADYILDTDNTIRKIRLNEVAESKRDYRRARGCNSLYVKFLNQQGGYCHWLFESHEETLTNNNLGGFVRDNSVDDLGNESASKLSIYSKVPEYYKGYLKDLVVSPEIYIYRETEWERVRSGKNTFKFDNISRSYVGRINFEIDYRFNPSLLWSN